MAFCTWPLFCYIAQVKEVVQGKFKFLTSITQYLRMLGTSAGIVVGGTYYGGSALLLYLYKYEFDIPVGCLVGKDDPNT